MALSIENNENEPNHLGKLSPLLRIPPTCVSLELSSHCQDYILSNKKYKMKAKQYKFSLHDMRKTGTCWLNWVSNGVFSLLTLRLLRWSSPTAKLSKVIIQWKEPKEELRPPAPRKGRGGLSHQASEQTQPWPRCHVDVCRVFNQRSRHVEGCTWGRGTPRKQVSRHQWTYPDLRLALCN